MAYGRVYIAADVSNGGCYVGQETGIPFSRMCAHLKSKKNDHFHHALRVRQDAFFWMIVCECEGKQELDDAEVEWGTYFNALLKKDGTGGYSLKLGNARGLASDLTRDRMSESLKVAANRPEVKQKKARTNALPEVKAKHAKAKSAAWSKPGVRERWIAALQEASNRPEVRDRKSEAAKCVWERADYREKRSKSLKATLALPEVRERRSQASKAMWAKRKAGQTS